ncbi:MAG: HD domain-containing protein [Planctomycetia bacterium]|nr:HD domain-containing protein [Planctomycetia bacterium]
MSESVVTAERPAPNAAPADQTARSHVAFKVADLVVGRRLRFPIEDSAGLLLLAAESVITPRFKQLLLARGVEEIMLSPSDVDGMSGGETPSRGLSADTTFDPAGITILNEMIDTGRLFREDTGAKFKDRLIQHGCKGFKSGQQQQLVQKHSETCTRLDALMKSAAAGGNPGGEEIANIVSDYLSELVLDTDCVLDVMAHTKDYAEIAQHCLQMSLLGMVMAIDADMSEADIRLVGLCGLIHDWGMTYVPQHIRMADRVLTRVEFLEIQKHPIYTLEMLRKIKAIPSQVPLVCYQVHERPNGTGYPRGRRGTNIHPCARILNVADAYAALVAPRPFRQPLEPYAALEYLIRQAAERMVDADAVRTLLHVVSQFPIGSTVQLSDGRKARVVRRNGNKYSSPIVQILEEADGTPTDPLDESLVLDPSEQNIQIVKVLSSAGREDVEASRSSVVLKRD